MGQKHSHMMSSPQSDISDSIIALRFKNMVRVIGAVVVFTAISVAAYVHLIYRVSTLECNVAMLVDVSVYKAAPRQPDCK